MSIQIAKNLSKILNERNINPTELSRLSGVPQPTLFKLLKGQSRSPGVETLEKVATALGVSILQIIYSPDLSEARPVTEFRKIPLLDWVQAGAFTMESNVDSVEEWYLCPVRISERGFCLRVRGESMEPKFHEGDIVFVDPDVVADPGKIVIVQDETFSGAVESTMKKLVRDGHEVFLKALNPDWPGKKFIPFTETMRVIGVVVGKYVEI